MIRPDMGQSRQVDSRHWLVVVGTVNEGFSFYGPFDDAKDADHWAGLYFKRDAYVLAEVLHPADLK